MIVRVPNAQNICMYGSGRLSLKIGLLQGLRHAIMVVPEMAEGVQSQRLPGCT